ncbi:DUF3099 domain-containing protein [Cellulomonas sp. SG140]|uniref:DUF3099 domain-containing protein n=1 Tax=Cellulomonas sp. SG140 TaxID=2976536 RepID=UPI0021E7C0F0|nr:DUF3099 domain-containing protein [Cellulomonas sp. SG140]
MSTPSGLPPEQPPVHRITTAPPSLSADQSRRQRSYLIQMGIRVVCFVGAVATFHRVPVLVTVLLVIGAVVLPYTAVLVANAGRERQARDASFLDPRLIGSSSRPDGRAAPADRGDTGTTADGAASRATSEERRRQAGGER